METELATRLHPPVNDGRDHALGEATAAMTLTEFGSYDCPHCRAANERIAEVRNRFGERLRYVFRHRPIPGSELAQRAAELAERADAAGKFWEAHVALMSRSSVLTEDDLRAVEEEFLPAEPPAPPMPMRRPKRVGRKLASITISPARGRAG